MKLRYCLILLFAMSELALVRADILPDPTAPEIFTVLKTFDIVSDVETALLAANGGQPVSISRVRGPQHAGFLLYPTEARLASGTVPADRGLFFFPCVKYSGQSVFKIDPTNTYGYLCVKNGDALVPVGHVFEGGGGGDQIYPDRLENLCTDDEYFRDRPDYEGHLTARVCDLRFRSGRPVITLH